MAIKTIVLDDDPTGTQSASDVTVLLELDDDALRDGLQEVLHDADSVYVQTNSRAIAEDAAVALVDRIRGIAAEIAPSVGAQLRFVLRGDSTLRGHVFAETARLMGADSVIVFCPAFPAGGRITVDGMHLVRIGERYIPADQTEFAKDPVFPFSTAVLTDYVRERSPYDAISVPLARVRAGALESVLRSASGGTVVVPDAETDADIALTAHAIEAASRHGRSIVVRCASALAAELAHVNSGGLLPATLVPTRLPTLVACGSHTAAATAQLDQLVALYGPPVIIDTDVAMDDPVAAGRAAAQRCRSALADHRLAIVATERTRRPEHATLRDGDRLMLALTVVVRELTPQVGTIVAKGGITSAELARVGIGARRARVLGQILPGISVWDLESPPGAARSLVVVPGNVGEPSTLVDVLTALGHRPGEAITPAGALPHPTPPHRTTSREQ